MTGVESPVGQQSGGNNTESSAGTDAPAELVTGFWTLVILVKIGVLVLGAGVVAIALTDHELAGVALIAIGGFVIGRWVMTYRRIRDRHLTEES